MTNNNITKPILFRPTSDQNKALERLNRIGFNRSKVIRLAWMNICKEIIGY